MIAVPVACVVDASVGIKLVVSEPDSALTHALFDHLAQDPAARFLVPELFFLECSNILWKLTRRGVLAEQDAKVKLSLIDRLPLQVLPCRPFIEEALNFALAYDITTYDATYAVVAEQNSLPLVTADERLAKKIGAAPCRVALLSAVSIPSVPPPRNP